MDAPFTIAHISDLHLSDPGRQSLLTTSPKRILAHLSWRRKRRHRHRREVLEAVVQRIRRARPDVLLITGDLTHLGLPEEYRQVRRWLEEHAAVERTLLVPGNHDETRAEPWLDALSQWSEWMASDGEDGSRRLPASREAFPSFRTFGDVALIGVSTARPSAPLFATGRVGPAQCERLGQHLREAGERGLFRVVFLHHPPGPETVSWRKRLTDAAALRECLRQEGAELVLHGHAHRFTRTVLSQGDGAIPIFGAGSASEYWPERERFGGFNLYSIDGERGAWTLRASGHAWNPDTRTEEVEESGCWSLPGMIPCERAKRSAGGVRP